MNEDGLLESPQISLLHSTECSVKTSLGSPLYSDLKGVVEIVEPGERKKFPVVMAVAALLKDLLSVCNSFILLDKTNARQMK